MRLAAVGAVAFCAIPLTAQDTDLLASQVSVSSSDARLALEFANGAHAEVSLRDGRVFIDGEDVGAYESGDALDRAWRALLGEAISLDGATLAETLRDWSPPEGASVEAGRRIDELLERLGTPPQVTARADQGAIEQRSLLELLRYADRLEGLGSVLAALDDAESLQVHIGEPVHVAEGETVEQSMLVVNADVDVDGRIVGDVIVVDGRVRIAEGASIDGDVQLLDARITNRGEVSGDIERLRAATEVRERELSELREQIRADIERELERGVGRSERSSRGLWSPFRNVASAVGGILENLLTFGVLVAIGAILLHFGGGRLETVAATARAYPARSAAVGMAGAFLAFPTWLLGVVVLAVTIIGIPVAIAWAPLFPLFIGLLALGGALAVAVNIGEWVAENRVRGFEWAAEPNTLYRMAAGLLAVTLVFVVANALQIAGSLLGFLHGLLSVVGTLAVIAMTIVGFGAMLLTRGGARPDLVGESFSFDDWRSGWRSEGYRSWGAGSAGAAAGDYATDLEDFASDVTDSAADVAHEAAEDLGDVADDAVDAAEDIVDTAAEAGRDAVADVEAAAGEAADAAQAAAEDLEDVVEEVFDGEVESDRPKPDRDDA